jgi:hypothetical protein
LLDIKDKKPNFEFDKKLRNGEEMTLSSFEEDASYDKPTIEIETITKENEDDDNDI